MNYKKFPYNILNAVFGGLTDNGEFEVSDSRELEGVIIELISTLLQEQQKVFLLHYRDGVSLKELAEQENLPFEEVEERIALTLRFLRHPIQSKQLFRYLKYGSFSSVLRAIKDNESLSLLCFKHCYQICCDESDIYTTHGLASRMYLINTLYNAPLNYTIKPDNLDEFYNFIAARLMLFIKYNAKLQSPLQFDESADDLQILTKSFNNVLCFEKLISEAIHNFNTENGLDDKDFPSNIKFCSYFLHCCFPLCYIPHSIKLIGKCKQLFYVGECDLNGFIVPEDIKQALFDKFKKAYEFLDGEIKIENNPMFNGYKTYCAYVYAMGCYLKASDLENKNLITAAINVFDHIGAKR